VRASHCSPLSMLLLLISTLQTFLYVRRRGSGDVEGGCFIHRHAANFLQRRFFICYDINSRTVILLHKAHAKHDIHLLRQ